MGLDRTIPDDPTLPPPTPRSVTRRLFAVGWRPSGLMVILLVPGLLAAPVLQSTILKDAVPGGVTPDLTLALTVFAALAWGSAVGSVWGFVGGLLVSAACGPGFAALPGTYVLAGWITGALGTSALGRTPMRRLAVAVLVVAFHPILQMGALAASNGGAVPRAAFATDPLAVGAWLSWQCLLIAPAALLVGRDEVTP